MHREGEIWIAMLQAFFLCSHHSVSPFLTVYYSAGLVTAWQLRDTYFSHKAMTCINIILKKFNHESSKVTLIQ